MVVIQVEINGKLVDVSKRELFDLAKTGQVQPETRLIYGDRDTKVRKVQGIIFAEHAVADTELYLSPDNPFIGTHPVNVPIPAPTGADILFYDSITPTSGWAFLPRHDRLRRSEFFPPAAILFLGICALEFMVGFANGFLNTAVRTGHAADFEGSATIGVRIFSIVANLIAAGCSGILLGLIIRRTRDTGNSGAWSIVPFISWVFLFMDSQIGDNRYGKSRKYISESISRKRAETPQGGLF